MVTWPLKTSDLSYVGDGVQRPETVLALASGDIYAGDYRGGMAKLNNRSKAEITWFSDGPTSFRPNGFSILPGREFLIANVNKDGGVWRVSESGQVTPHILEVDGRRLPGTNSVFVDAKGRTWISVSSWQNSWSITTRKGAIPDGCLILVDSHGARIAAEGLGYTNEAKIDPSGEWLYVNETAGRRLSRFKIGADSRLGRRQTVTEFSDGSFPDGLAFDSQGGCWVACIGSQRIIRVDYKTGEQTIVLDESSPEIIAFVEKKYDGDEMRPWDGPDGTVLGSVSGLCFGGHDMKTVYLGSLTRSGIATFRSPIAGAVPHFWNY
jgi:sugar lactone lactonase YvrE